MPKKDILARLNKNTFNYEKVTAIDYHKYFRLARNVQRIARWKARTKRKLRYPIEFERGGESGCSTRFHALVFLFFFPSTSSTHRGGDKWRWIRQRSAVNDGRRTVHGPERGGRRTSLAVAETRPVVCTPNTRAWRICIALYKQCF